MRKSLFRLFPVFLIVYEFCTNMSNDMYLPALTVIANDFSTSLNYVQLTISAWLAGDTAVQLLIGPLTDRYGRRPILFGGGLLFLLSTLGCALAPSLFLLILARFIQGIGVCSMMVAGYASIHDLYDDEKAIHILAWMGSAAVLAPAIGPALGGVFLLFASWRVVFYFLFFLGIAALLGLWFAMPESTTYLSRKTISIKGLFKTYLRIFCSSSFLISALSYSLLYGGIIGWITSSPFILMETLGLTPTKFGWLQVPVFGSYIIGAKLIKSLMKNIDREQQIFTGLLFAGLSGIFLVIFSYIEPLSILSYLIPMIGYAIGFGFAAAPLNRITLISVDEQKGAAISVFYLIMTGCGSIISIILSLVNETVFLASLIIALSILLSFALNGLRQKYVQDL